MLFVSLRNPEDLPAVPTQADGIELRLDLFAQIDLRVINDLITASRRPVMLTLRRKGQEPLIKQLLPLEPAFFDLEWDSKPEFIQRMIHQFPKTKFVLSYHNFEETPQNLNRIYQAMSRFPVYAYKMALFSHSTNDALRALLFAKQHSRLSAICMGEMGAFARVLGLLDKTKIHFASLDQVRQTAPGQLAISDLYQVYRYDQLNAQTALYGLIGDPVEQSQGHLYHNARFQKQQLNALYVKMRVREEELSVFFSMAQEIGFQGLSVTMPLKEKVLPFLTHSNPIGAVNTLLFKEEEIIGSNTDGMGALDALEKRGSVAGKKLVILGAGGAGRAIAFEAKRRGADVWVLNRTVPKAQEIGATTGCRFGSLSDIPPDYDILINCTSDPMPIDPKQILRKALVMDINYSQRTSLIQKACELGCQTIHGDEMFLNQAEAQSILFRESANG